MKIRCIIVDDELLAREGLQAIIAERSDVEVISSCADGLSAIEAIESLKPDLVLLDVQMPGVNGFEVITSVSKPRPYVIFITAHDQYALKAFEISAVDYLLKPFSDERFDNAVNKAADLIRKDELAKNSSLEALISHTNRAARGQTQILNAKTHSETLVFKSDGLVHRIPYDNISHVEAYDYYVKIHTGEHFHLIRETMKKMSEQLPEKSFIRIHKSYIVNVSYIRQYGKSDEEYHQVVLSNGKALRVSRSYKKGLDRHFQ